MLTDPLLQAGGRSGLGSTRLAVLQGTALVVHAATLELAQQVEEALLVGGRGPGDALRMGVGRCWLQRRPCSGHQPHRSLGTTEGAGSARGQRQDPPLSPAGHTLPQTYSPACSFSSSQQHHHPALSHSPLQARHVLPLGRPHPATPTPLHSLKCPCWPSYTPTVVCARARGASNIRSYH